MDSRRKLLLTALRVELKAGNVLPSDILDILLRFTGGMQPPLYCDLLPVWKKAKEIENA